MRSARFSLTFLAGVFCVFGSGCDCVFAQAGLPLTVPTGSVVQGSRAAVTAGASAEAKVAYAGGTLEVTADGSSLNGILRKIASETGMRLVGSVSEERVYGKYGPAPTIEVLKELLDGTRCNMVLKETAKDQPAELIVTLRSGAFNLPGLDSGTGAESAPAWTPPAVAVPAAPPEQHLVAPTAVTETPPEPASSAGSAASGSPDAGAPAPQPTDPAATAPPPQTTGATDPTATSNDPTSTTNALKTPEQVAEELQRMQQQQQANQR